MTNPHKGEVQFEAGGETYTLRFSIDNICAVEEKSGKGLASLASALGDPDRMSVSGVRYLLWGALREDHPSVNLLQAGNLIIAGGGMLKMVALINTALERAFPQDSGGDQNPPVPGQDLTGPAS